MSYKNLHKYACVSAPAAVYTSWVDKMICLGAPCWLYCRQTHLHDRTDHTERHPELTARRISGRDLHTIWSPKKAATNFKQCKALFIFNWGHQRRHRLLQKHPPRSLFLSSLCFWNCSYQPAVCGAPPGSQTLRFSIGSVLYSPFSGLYTVRIWNYRGLENYYKWRII